jgi:hypothetical protein
MGDEMDGACINHRRHEECIRNAFGTPEEQIQLEMCMRNVFYSRERSRPAQRR